MFAHLPLTPTRLVFSSTERQEAAERDYRAWLTAREADATLHIGSSTFVRAGATRRGISGLGDCPGA